MNKTLRLTRVEHRAAARTPLAGEYGAEWQAKLVKRLTEVMEEQGGPEGLRVWLESLHERRGPSLRGVDWGELNAKMMTFARLLWRDGHGNPQNPGE